jgi:ABC-type phosphate/phosphonate transport system substrate-binding protein
VRFFHQFWTFSSVTSAAHFTWPTTAMKAAGARTKACGGSDHFQSMTYGYD